MVKKNNVPKSSKDKGRLSVNRKASGITTLAASIAVSLGLILTTASKKNDNYDGNHRFSHNLKEMTGGEKKLERGKPIPGLTGRMIITHEGVPYEVNDTIKVSFDVDEHFDLNTHIIDGNGYKNLESIMRNVALGKDTSAVVGFDYVKDGVEPNLSPQGIKISSVEGHASPEAIKYEGSSLKIGNIESENIATAEYRAEVGRDSLMTVVAKIAADNPDLDIDVSSISISGDEIQLNEDELKILEDMASFAGYPSVESMIYANERGEIEDQSIVEVINKIINSKRNVTITFTKKGNPDTIYVIPLVLLPILIFKRRKTRVGGAGTGVGGGGTGVEGGGTETGGGGTGVEGGGTETGGGGTGAGGGGTETGGGGGGGRIKRFKNGGVSGRPFVEPKLMYKQWTERPAVQRKQPRDKRPHNFSNERQGGFNRSRRGRTN